MFMILGLVHLDAIVSCDADLPVVPAKQQRKPLKVVTELLQCRCGSGMTEPEPRFGETFGFALFCQDSVSFAVFARFFTGFARFRPFFAPFSRENSRFLPGFARFCPVLPILPGLFGFVQIHQDSFSFVRPLFAWFRPSLFLILPICCLKTLVNTNKSIPYR